MLFSTILYRILPDNDLQRGASEGVRFFNPVKKRCGRSIGARIGMRYNISLRRTRENPGPHHLYSEEHTKIKLTDGAARQL